MADQVKVTMFNQCFVISHNMISMKCGPCKSEDECWKKFAPKLLPYENEAKENYFLGYFSLIDIVLYEMFFYLPIFFPNEVKNFPKFERIHRTVQNIPQIQ